MFSAAGMAERLLMQVSVFARVAVILAGSLWQEKDKKGGPNRIQTGSQADTNRVPTGYQPDTFRIPTGHLSGREAGKEGAMGNLCESCESVDTDGALLRQYGQGGRKDEERGRGEFREDFCPVFDWPVTYL